MQEKPAAIGADEALRLGQLALERKWITPEQLREALALQVRNQTERSRHRPLGNILIERGYLTDVQLVELLDLQRKGSGPPPFGKYRIVRELGRGGMGVVYEALDTQLHRKVALKLMLGNALADHKENRLEEERFLREARITANLAKHPNLVSVYEAGTIDGKRYLAMELIEGVSFAKWRKSGSVTIRQQVKVLRDVALGIHHAHRQGTIHRDLKPDNILVDDQGQPHVTDFGLAKSVGQNVHLSLTASGMIMGTPAYMSPEQALGDKGIDHRTDIYALGVLLFETLTGRQPFTGETPIEILMKAAKEPIPAPSSMIAPGTNPTLDRTIENICLKSLAKKAHDRYASAELLAADLSKWLKGEEVHVPLAVPTRRKMVQPKKSPAWTYAAAGGALAVVLGFLALRSPDPPRPVPAVPSAVSAKLERERAQREADRIEIERLKRERDQALQDAESARKRSENARSEADRAKADEELRQAVSRRRAVEEKEPNVRAARGDSDRPEAAPPGSSPAPAAEDAWLKSVAALSPVDQVQRVIERLREKNPGFDGRETHEIQGADVVWISLSAVHVKDLSPLRALPHLNRLSCTGSYDEKTQELVVGELSSLEGLRGMNLIGLALTRTLVEDLSPLAGMKLQKIDLGWTRVADLGPLRGMPLEVLDCWGTPVQDLSPVDFRSMVWLNVFRTKVSDLGPAAGAPLRGLIANESRVTSYAPLSTMKDLRELFVDFDPKRDTAVLRSLKLLEKINGLPAAEFWKKQLPAASTGDWKTGLVAHWKLNEGSGIGVAEGSGAKFRGKLVGGAQWLKGKPAANLHVDGTSGSIELPNAPILDRLQEKSYTMSAWFKPDRLPPNTDHNSERYTIVGKRGWSEGIFYNHSGQFCADHWLSGDENTMAGTWENTYPPGRFYLVTGVIDIPAGRTQIYVDDRLMDTSTWTERKPTRDFGSEIWRIGINDPGGDQYRWAALGVVGDVRLYNRALKAADVEALFKAECASHDR